MVSRNAVDIESVRKIKAEVEDARSSDFGPDLSCQQDAVFPDGEPFVCGDVNIGLHGFRTIGKRGFEVGIAVGLSNGGGWKLTVRS